MSVLMAGVRNFYANDKEALDKIEFRHKKKCLIETFCRTVTYFLVTQNIFEIMVRIIFEQSNSNSKKKLKLSISTRIQLRKIEAYKLG